MKKFLAIAVFCPALLVSCADPAADMPPAEDVTTSLNRVLADTGIFTDAAISRVIGKHYVPGEDRWQIVACFGFTDAAGNPSLECADSFSLFRLDSGSWIVSFDRSGIYRWREVLPLQAASGKTLLEQETNN